MKNLFFIFALMFLSNVYARSSGPGPGWGMEIDRESFGGEIYGPIDYNGSNMNSEGLGGSGRIMSDCPGSLDIGGFDGMRSLDLPTSFEGNIGGRF